MSNTKKEEAPGYDFLTLTKSQWRHLRRVERDHGIPWNVQIRNLVKSDMDGKGIPSSGKKPHTPMTEKRIIEAVTRIEDIFKRIESGKLKITPYMLKAQSGDFSAVFDEEEQLKVSELAQVEVDPDMLSDGTDVNAAIFRDALLNEVRAKMGMCPIEEERARITKDRKKAHANAVKPIKNVPIQFPSHVKTIDPKTAPDPPPSQASPED